MNIYGVLMAGGTGTRFWPRSRRAMPKQVLNIFGENTMIQETHQRLAGLVKDANILIVTNGVQQEIISRQLTVLEENNYIIEPFGRNTAPCIGLAALHIAQDDPDGVMVVLPADHLITDVETFQSV
ncbi:MAG TPA: sugar phosphate nucleotidyltransferase, partial [Calditrichia bacterium]|nr:sugar phosphate nucleotidyltransferase [Calditrichia bacterium]